MLMSKKNLFSCLRVDFDVEIVKVSPAVYVLARPGAKQEGYLMFVSPSMRTKSALRAYAESHFDYILHLMYPDHFPLPPDVFIKSDIIDLMRAPASSVKAILENCTTSISFASDASR